MVDKVKVLLFTSILLIATACAAVPNSLSQLSTETSTPKTLGESSELFLSVDDLEESGLTIDSWERREYPASSRFTTEGVSGGEVHYKHATVDGLDIQQIAIDFQDEERASSAYDRSTTNPIFWVDSTEVVVFQSELLDSLSTETTIRCEKRDAPPELIICRVSFLSNTVFSTLQFDINRQELEVSSAAHLINVVADKIATHE